MERTKFPTLKSARRSQTVEIRSRANLLPFKALIYAVSSAQLKAPRSSRERLREQFKNLTNSMRILNLYAERFYNASGPTPSGPNASEPDPLSSTETIKTAIDNYVSLFYCMTTHERASYIRALSGMRHKVKNESNMLYFPAIMSEAGEEQKTVKGDLFKHLYAMPFRILCNSSKTGLRVMLQQTGMAVGSVKYEVMHDFSKSVSLLDARMLDIASGKINPIKDEELKEEFLEQAVKMSRETDINIVEIISDRVRTDSHIRKEALRLMRRAIHVTPARKR